MHKALTCKMVFDLQSAQPPVACVGCTPATSMLLLSKVKRMILITLQIDFRGAIVQWAGHGMEPSSIGNDHLARIVSIMWWQVHACACWQVNH